MKTEPSYTFQHSLLTREVFITVHGHFQSEESHKKNQIGNCICIASYQLALCTALTTNPISQRDNGLQCRRDTWLIDTIVIVSPRYILNPGVPRVWPSWTILLLGREPSKNIGHLSRQYCSPLSRWEIGAVIQGLALGQCWLIWCYTDVITNLIILMRFFSLKVTIYLYE